MVVDDVALMEAGGGGGDADRVAFGSAEFQRMKIVRRLLFGGIGGRVAR